MDPSLPPISLNAIKGRHPAPSDMRQAAIDLEASFLSEMLKHAGLGRSRGAFGGGPGEDQFAAMLCDYQAQAMAEAGGIGLAEQFYRSISNT
ncbi:rod-binding protein [Pseudooceanicola sp. C21-150M6]|uniref:rod-binding protein n=1 Tax=Pseudooceanicola sp. C21-150M6 TaxID=3434355 RepID=UPI003D7FFF5E